MHSLFLFFDSNVLSWLISIHFWGLPFSDVVHFGDRLVHKFWQLLKFVRFHHFLGLVVLVQLSYLVLLCFHKFFGLLYFHVQGICFFVIFTLDSLLLIWLGLRYFIKKNSNILLQGQNLSRDVPLAYGKINHSTFDAKDLILDQVSWLQYLFEGIFLRWFYIGFRCE